MAVVLFVRVQTSLAPEVLADRARARTSEFSAIPGLIQKVYGRDPATGDVCGIYFFESREHLGAFRDTGLAGSIAASYEATNVRAEVYEVLMSLHPDVGPFPSS